jgi:hypothetical protein
VFNARTLVRYGAIIAAGFAVDRVVTMGWRAASGHEPPSDPEDIDTHTGEVILYAVVSGALIALARVLAIRGAAKAYTKVTAKPLTTEAVER